MNIQKPVNQSKLVSLLKTLSNKEMALLDSYLEAPFFNNQEAVTRLFKLLKALYPNFSKPVMKSELYFSLFPGEKQSGKEDLSKDQDKKIRYLMNYLSTSVQEFLIYQYRQQETADNQYALSQVFMMRGLYKFIPALLKNTNKLQQKQRHKDPGYYFRQYRLEEAEFHFNLLTNNRSKAVGNQQVIHRFHQYYLANQLRYFCAAVNRENILQVSYDYPMIDEILLHLKQNDYRHVPLIYAYYRILLMLRGEQSETHYMDLKTFMTHEKDAFPIEERHQILSFMLNFCNAQIKRGQRSYIEDKHQIYVQNLPDRVWFIGKHLKAEHFILMVKNAVALRLYKWVREFISEYSPHLPPKKQTQLNCLGNAYLNFSMGDYDAAHSELMRVGPSDDIFYELYYRLLMIQLYFEESLKKGTEKFEGPVFSALEALRFYISPARNANLSEGNRLAYANFVNLAKRLYRLSFSKAADKTHQVKRLEEDIKSADYLEERYWLLEKAEATSSKG